MRRFRGLRFVLATVLASLIVTACGSGDAGTLTVYSGRSENLIGPLLEQFTEETGIDVDVRYGDSADMALLIETEGDRSPADVFISQSPGAIGFLAGNARLTTLDGGLLDEVDADFRNADGRWVGLSGRVRVIVYNPELIDVADLPTSVFELTEDRYRGRVGIAPSNGSFQDFVTGMRELHGDEVTLEWLEGMAANDAQPYAKNSAIVQAVGLGEVPLGLVNHYYNLRAKAEDPAVTSENYFLPAGDIGSLVIVTAAGILDTADDVEAATRLIEFLLSEPAQTFFSEETLEYPLAAGVSPSEVLPPMSTIGMTTYDFDQLGGGLERTKELIDASGLEAP